MSVFPCGQITISTTDEPVMSLQQLATVVAPSEGRPSGPSRSDSEGDTVGGSTTEPINAPRPGDTERPPDGVGSACDVRMGRPTRENAKPTSRSTVTDGHEVLEP